MKKTSPTKIAHTLLERAVGGWLWVNQHLFPKKLNLLSCLLLNDIKAGLDNIGKSAKELDVIKKTINFGTLGASGEISSNILVARIPLGSDKPYFWGVKNGLLERTYNIYTLLPLKKNKKGKAEKIIKSSGWLHLQTPGQRSWLATFNTGARPDDIAFQFIFNTCFPFLFIDKTIFLDIEQPVVIDHITFFFKETPSKDHNFLCSVHVTPPRSRLRSEKSISNSGDIFSFDSRPGSPFFCWIIDLSLLSHLSPVQRWEFVSDIMDPTGFVDAKLAEQIFSSIKQFKANDIDLEKLLPFPQSGDEFKLCFWVNFDIRNSSNEFDETKFSFGDKRAHKIYGNDLNWKIQGSETLDLFACVSLHRKKEIIEFKKTIAFGSVGQPLSNKLFQAKNIHDEPFFCLDLELDDFQKNIEPWLTDE
jgi:hypothetical protein